MTTFAHEDTLPRVPLPSLEETCVRFLDWCAPLLSAEQFADTAAAVEEFTRTDGPALHAALARYDAEPGTHSWLDTFWPARYLGRRDRIALNANFVFLFADTPSDDHAEPQVERAATLTAAAVRYKRELDAEHIPPVTNRGTPLSMEQNKYLFSTTRIPGAVQDTVRAPYSDAEPGPSRARHVVVLHGGAMFRMDVLGVDGRPYSRDDITAGLRAVLKEPGQGDGVGRLTTKARAEWAASRDRLIALDPANAAAFDTIETALFCVCLEDEAPADDLAACDGLLHGNSANRWFDKAVSLVVFTDGTAGINVEHCGLDGTTILSFVDTLLAPVDGLSTVDLPTAASGQPAVEPIAFVLDDAARADIRAAAESFAAFAAGTASTVVSFTDFGVSRVKELGLSPDAFAQLAYQVAHRRAKGFTGATYESIATRQYRRGRTEAMRVVTPEVVRFVSTMDDPAATPDLRRAALRAAAQAHVRRAKECQAGQAPEQHLWELQLLQRRRGEPQSRLYTTPGWNVMRDDYLSTSSAPSRSIRYFGFGATSSHCIGVAYVLLPEAFRLYLSTPRTGADAMHAFAARLREAFTQMHDLLAGGN
jgi:carnitine O-acetyltransferase